MQSNEAESPEAEQRSGASGSKATAFGSRTTDLAEAPRHEDALTENAECIEYVLHFNWHCMQSNGCKRMVRITTYLNAYHAM